MRPHRGTAFSPAVGQPWLKGCLYHCVAAGQGAVVSAPILSLLLVYTRPSSCSFFFFKHTGFYSFIFKDFFLAASCSSGDCSSLQCTGFSSSQLLSLQSMGLRHVDSVVVAHGLNCTSTCGIFLDPGSNLCSLHRQADS